ncbi:viroplasmin family protein [Carboxylicivirga sp. M1479]|uniref:ribonuclease H1 domain-containing protein n=1 Tax=Carboxylicivirga sp. M1479 TaxID=2594476 RepID=UPI0011776A57|nr:ribonuclease H family protein [Carboxylicivirga sp. M1479]TRX62365.1 ribonuclease H [Carboxylicivirga sp. M1479]
MAKNKYYVVWVGAKPGIYSSWPECQAQIKGFPAAKYKGFATLVEAQKAMDNGFKSYISSATKGSTNKGTINSKQNIISNSIAVDAACSGNPGVMEYQGVYTKDSRQLFHQKFPLGTNNIGEFIALVHGISYLQKNKLNIPIYSDSKIAIGWVQKKKCKTKLPDSPKTKALFDMIERAENWLKNNTVQVKILKWDTKNWGEIPADFGRK